MMTVVYWMNFHMQFFSFVFIITGKELTPRDPHMFESWTSTKYRRIFDQHISTELDELVWHKLDIYTMLQKIKVIKLLGL